MILGYYFFSLIFICFKISCQNEEEETINIYKSNSDEIIRSIMQNGPCNIPVENDVITNEEFLRKYAYKSPVVFKKNGFQTKRNQLFAAKSHIDNLLTEYADKRVTISTANTYSYRKFTMRFDDYIKEQVFSKTPSSYLNDFGNETLYFFGDNNYTEWQSLFDIYEKPVYTLPDHIPMYSFGVAAEGSGVPFHFHGPGFAETMHGRKRWFLYEPSQKPNFDPDKTTLQWLLEEYPKLSETLMPLECILEPFDIIYFPDRWWHATLNVDTAVFISTFLSSSF